MKMVLALFCVLVTMFLTQSMAQQQTLVSEKTPEDWDVRLGLPLWAAGLDGTVGINGRLAKVDESFTDILDVLDWAAALNLEVRKSRWLFLANGLYSKVSADATPGGLIGGVVNDVELREKQLLANVGLGYKVLDRRGFSLEVLGGARINALESQIILRLPASSPSFSKSMTWVDPIFGGIAEFRLTKPLALFTQADVGGFGVNSDLTWQVNGGLQWDFSRHWYLRGSYRFLHTDFDRDGFRYDLDQGGPQLEIGLHF